MNTTIIDFISNYGYLAVAILIAVENIFPPIQSEIILTFSGFLYPAHHGREQRLQVLYSQEFHEWQQQSLLFSSAYLINADGNSAEETGLLNQRYRQAPLNDRNGL